MLGSLAALAILVPQEPAPHTVPDRVLPRVGITLGSALERREHEIEQAASGRLSHDLRTQLAARTPAERLQVAVWLARPAGMPDLREALDAELARGAHAEDARRAAMRIAESATLPHVEAFAARVRSAGFAVDHADRLVPVVFVTLAAEDVGSLGRMDGVDQVYFAFQSWLPEEGACAALPNEWASPTARTDVVHRRGITGAGVKVLVNDVGGVARTNPNLPPIVVGTAAVGVQAHATAVAGIIASRHALQRGAAPGLAQLYDYGGASDVAAPQAWAWGMQQGISFGNCSWWNGNRGSIAFLDRYFDYVIRNFAVQLFKSAGNQGNNQPCTTPGNGFNSIASGNADDRNTHDWDDDVLATSSSTGNPQPEGHEKPEVTAHGTTITTTDTGGSVSAQGTGTSYASPVSCGTAALLAATDPVLLAAPEAIKALLMAGAWNDIAQGQPLSDWDGAGGVDAAASQSAVARGQYRRATLTPASFPNGIHTVSIALDAGDETRLCAVWTASADSSYTATVLQMDLDLVVRAPNGAVVASSASTRNPFEIVQFVPPSTGTYTVELLRMRFLGASEPFAMAWTTSWDARTCAVAISGSPRLGATIGIQWSDRYHPGQVYVGFLSVSPYPATWRVPTNKLMLVGFDSLSEASILLPGFLGALSATGTATTSLTIPNLPGLDGLTVLASMVTLQSGAPVAEEIGELASFTILP